MDKNTDLNRGRTGLVLGELSLGKTENQDDKINKGTSLDRLFRQAILGTHNLSVL